jgi:hypothetical protein
MVRSFEETDRAVEAFLDSTGRNGLGLVCGTFYLYDVVIRALED